MSDGPRGMLTTHVLDAVTGRPAAGLEVTLVGPDGAALATCVTDDDGRVDALGPPVLPAGTHRLTFGVGAWFAAHDVTAFYPEVVIAFVVGDDPAAHYHVPLLLSPYAYSTYRGS